MVSLTQPITELALYWRECKLTFSQVCLRHWRHLRWEENYDCKLGANTELLLSIESVSGMLVRDFVLDVSLKTA